MGVTLERQQRVAPPAPLERGDPGLLRGRFGQRTWVSSGLLLDGIGPLQIYLALLFFIPAAWVLPGLGAAGRPASVFAIGMFVMWAVTKMLPRFGSAASPMRWPLLGYGLAFLVAYALAVDRGLPPIEARALDRAFLQLIAWAGIILMASEGLSSYRRIERCLVALVFVSSTVVVLALSQFFLNYDVVAQLRFPGLVRNVDINSLRARGVGGLVRAKGTAIHPIEFGVTTAMVLPVALHLALSAVRGRSRKWLYVAVAIHGLGVAIAISRSAIVAFVVVMGVLFWSWSYAMRIRAAIVGLFGLVLLRLGVPGLLGTIRGLFTNWDNDPSIRGRTDDYAEVGRFIGERPWFGRGPGTFIPTEYIVLDNAYLGRTIMSGFVGMAAYLLLVLSALYLLYRCRTVHADNRVRQLCIALTGSLLAALVASATFDFHAFPTVTGVHLLYIGVAGALFRLRWAPVDESAAVGSDAVAPILRRGVAVGTVRQPWWVLVPSWCLGAIDRMRGRSVPSG